MQAESEAMLRFWIGKHGELWMLLLLLLLGFYVSCSSERKFRILSVFFDGVPPPPGDVEMEADSLLTGTASGSGVDALAARRRPQFFLHEVYREKACDSCHNLDEGNRLVEEPPELCYTCHDDYREQWANLHGPVSAGLCVTCHNPHLAKYDKLLFAEGQKVCTKCHDRAAVFKNEVHADIEDTNCVECHNPHGGDEEFFLQ